MKVPQFITLSAAFGAIALTACMPDDAAAEKPKDSAPKKETAKPSDKPSEGKEEIDYSKITEAEWRKRLTPEQYRILREAGTERAYGEAYKQFKAQGEGHYACAGCGAELFSSKEKFDSHCGWPSFYDPSKAKNVTIKRDFTAGMIRTEVLCARCNGHLGHVFTGEGFQTPTDKRYCINGASLKFVPGKVEKTGSPKTEEKKRE
jgi:peptide-methionine (R)-S-oxide reductase